jgi:protein-disulfide isomerase
MHLTKILFPCRFIQIITAMCFLTLHAETTATNYSDSLNKKQLKQLTIVTSDFKMNTICKGSLFDLTQNNSPCSVAIHLYNFAAWLALKDSTRDYIKKQLQVRYDFFTSPDTLSIDTTGYPHIGNPKNPIVITAYTSSTCNLCKVIVRAVEDSILHGSLNNKAVLVIKPFSAGIGDMAKMAAFKQQQFKTYSDALAQIKERFTERDLITIADSTGLDTIVFTNSLKDSTTRAFLLKSRSEGIQNGVEVTPTFFINAKRYRSYKDPQWIIDAVSVMHKMQR